MYDFLLATNEIMELHGVKLPLASQGTTEESTRFETGLAKQVALFGSGMETARMEKKQRGGC